MAPLLLCGATLFAPSTVINTCEAGDCSPVLAGEVNPGAHTDVTIVSDSLAFTVMAGCCFPNGQINTIDISDKSNPQLLATLDVLDSFLQSVGHGEGDVLYVGGSQPGKLMSYDISDPTSPVQLDEVSLSAVPIDIHVHGDLAFVTEDAFGAAADFFHIIDISDPNNLSILWTTSVPWPDGPINDPYVDGTTLRVIIHEPEDLGGDPTVIRNYDITDPANPVLGEVWQVGTDQDLPIQTRARYMATSADGRYHYITAGTLELWVFDTQAPFGPEIVGVVSTGLLSSRITVAGDHAYIRGAFNSGSGQGFSVVDISDPTAPTVVGAFEDFDSGGGNPDRPLYVIGDHLYLTMNAQFEIWNVESCVPPLNDTPDAPEPVNDGDTIVASFAGASASGSSSCEPVGVDLFYEVTLTETSDVSVDTCGSQADTALALFDSLDNELQCALACTGDPCADVTACVEAPELAPGNYLIRVSQQNGARGSAPNDSFVMNVMVGALACPADIAEGDGAVNVFDLLELLAGWGSNGPGADLAEPNDVIDVFDLLTMLAEWGPC